MVVSKPVTPKTREKEGTNPKAAKAEQLRRVWLREKIRQNLTQESLATKMGIKQGTLGGYLAGRYHVDAETVLKFAEALEISPSEIDPEIVSRFKRKELTDRTFVQVPVRGNLTGEGVPTGAFVVISLLKEKQQRMCYAVEINLKDYEPMLKQGAHAICDPLAVIEEGDYIAARKRESEEYTIFRAMGIGGNGRIRVCKPTPHGEQVEELVHTEVYAEFDKITAWDMP